MRPLATALIPLCLAACSGGPGAFLPDAGGDGGCDADADADADGDTDSDPGDPGAPLYGAVGVYQTVIAANGDPADVWYPSPPDLAEGGYSFPVALLLQGAEVGRAHYAGFAAAVAAYGFVVVVPDHQSLSATGPGLYAQQYEAADVVAHMAAENGNPAAPVAGAVDAETLVLLGHSYGGVCGLNVVRGVCQMPTCAGLFFHRPEQLVGAAFYGTNVSLPFIGSLIATIANDGIPTALVQGTLDGKALPADTEAAFAKIQDPPKALVRVLGANHYGICDEDNPAGAAADANAPTLAQAVAVGAIARWSALFLRAFALGDPAARQYVAVAGDPADPDVEISLVE